MILLINCAIKVSLILVVTLVAAHLLRRRSAALRHCVLAAGVLSAAVTPGLSVLIPGWSWNVMIEAPKPLPAPQEVSRPRSFVPMPLPRQSETAHILPAQPATTPAAVNVSSYTLSTNETLVSIWGVGFSISFAVLLFGYTHLAWITRGSHPLNSEEWRRIARLVAREYGLPCSPRLLQNDRLSVLFTWGWRRPRVLVPEGAPSWPAERIHAVLCHELAHIRRGDWVIQMMAELVRAVYWFNPLLWIACRNLRRESEQACDDAALNAGITGSDYAAHVLDVVKSLRQPKRPWSYALSMAGPSTLEQRFKAMLNPGLNRETLTRVSLGAIMLGFVLITLPLSALRGATAAAEPALLLPAIAGVPVPAEAWQIAPATPTGTGIVQGIVKENGSGRPIPGVEIALEGGPADEKLVDTLVRAAGAAGIVFKPTRVDSVDALLQEAIDAGAARGVGPGFPLFQGAIDTFKTAAAARFTTISDRDGRFTVRNVPSGVYRVHPGREDFAEETVEVRIPTVSVSPNQTSEATVFMTACAVISGRIVDASGRPMQDVVVDALAMTYENGYPVLRTSVSKTTDDQGEYRLFWLLPGEYYIQVTVPAPGAQGLRGADGSLQITTSVPRVYYPGTIDLGAAAPIPVRSGDKLSGIDVQLKTTRLPRLSGVVTTPIPDAEVAKQGALYNAAASRPVIMLVSRDPNRPDVTGAGARVIATVVLNNGTGKFETQGIPPGSYIVFARMPADNSQGGAGFAFGRIHVDVGNDDISGLTIAVHKSVNVSGRVTIDGKPAATGAARVTLRVDDASMKLGIYSTLSQRYVPSDAEGLFSVIGVTPGSYHVDVGPGLPRDLYVADVRQAARSVFDSGFEVGAQTPDPIQVVLSSGAGRIEGVVADVSGKSVGGATVVLAPPENRRQNRALFHQTITDKAGRFTMQNLAPGAYKLFAWQQDLPSSTWFNEGFMARYEANGRGVNVAQGVTMTQQIPVIP
jgi:beta-lactamase regulating signal transducer with metallopeptidase domain